MTQRILLAACLLTTAVCLTLTGFVWHQANQSALATAESNHRLAELLATTQAGDQVKLVELVAENQRTNEQILKHLQAMGKTSQSPDWVPLSFKLTFESADGPPAAGFEITLFNASTGLLTKQTRRESDSSGLADFGVVHPGEWNFTVTRSSDGKDSWDCEGSIAVLPATNVVKSVFCPQIPPATSKVAIHVMWPEDLAREHLSLEMAFDRAPIKFQPGITWSVIYTDRQEWSRVLCGPERRQEWVGAANKLLFWHHYEMTQGSQSIIPVFADLHWQGKRRAPDTVVMEVGSYLARRLVILKARDSDEAKTKSERLEVLAYALPSEGTSNIVESYSDDPRNGADPLGSHLWSLGNFKGGVAVPPSYWRDLEKSLTVRRGEINEWAIPLPDEVIEAAREALKAPRPDWRVQRSDGLSIAVPQFER
jgi:hypothetical protein